MVTNYRYGLVFILSFFIGITSPISVNAMVNDMFDNQEEMIEENNQETDQPADSETPMTNENTMDSPNFLSSLVRLIVVLAIIIGLIILIAKFLQNKNGFLKRHQVIENFGGITVGSNKTIQTIKIADRFFVIGVGENIELLMEITDQQTIDQLLEQKEDSQALIQNVKNKFAAKQDHMPDKPKQNFEMLFHKELKSMKESRRNLYNRMKERQNNDDH